LATNHGDKMEVCRMGEMTDTYIILVSKPNGDFEGISVDVRIILK
jgi:hypothetical protein